LNNILSIKRNNAISLATLLVLGTISTILPSVQAQPYHEDRYNPDYPSYQDNNYYKSKDSSVNVNKIKCNNINVNVNGLEFNVFPPFLGGSGLAAEAADEANTDASSFTGNGANGDISKINDFRFICINNNNNTVIEEEQPLVEECPEADNIESCFRQILSDFLFPRFVEALESEAGITVEINGQEVTLRSFEDICLALEGLTFEQLTIAIGDIIAGAGIELTFPSLSGLIQCISTALNIDVLSQ
jgi:hypothetical protein